MKRDPSNIFSIHLKMAIPPKVLILRRLSIHMKNLEIPVHNLQVIPQVLTVAAGTNLAATIVGVFFLTSFFLPLSTRKTAARALKFCMPP